MRAVAVLPRVLVYGGQRYVQAAKRQPLSEADAHAYYQRRRRAPAGWHHIGDGHLVPAAEVAPRTWTLYHGHPQVDRLAREGFGSHNVSGFSSHLDVNGVHLTRTPRVAQVFAGKEHGGGVVRVSVPLRNPLHLTPEDIERRGVHLAKVGERYRKTDGSKEDLIKAWQEDAESRGMSREAIDYTTSAMQRGELKPTNNIQIALTTLGPEHGFDGVIWPRLAGIPGLQHHGEDEVTVFDPKLIQVEDVHSRNLGGE